MSKDILTKKQCSNQSQCILEKYRMRATIVSKAKVYESDKEIAEAVKESPRDSVSVKRYRSYSFSTR